MLAFNRWGVRAWVFTLVAAASLPGAAALLWLGFSSERAVERSAIAHQQALAAATAARVDAALGEAEQLLGSLATRPLIRALDPSRCDPILGELRSLHLLYTSVDVTDARGAVICTTPPRMPGPNSHAGAPWIREVIERNRFTAGEPQRGATSGRWVLALASPISSPGGPARGAVVIALDLMRFGERLRPDAGGLSRATLLSQRATILARSTPDAEQLIGLDRRGEPVVVRAMALTAGAMTAPDREGTLRIYGIATTRNGWRLVVSVPEALMLAPARARARDSLAIGLAALGLVAAAALQLSRRVTRPILDLTAVARTATTGGLLARATEEGPREVREAVLHFNALLDARGRAESALLHANDRATLLNRLLRTTWGVSQIMARASDRRSVLEGACRGLVEVGGMSAAWVGFSRPDGGVEPFAACGILLEDVSATRVDDTPAGQGAFGRAVRSGQMQVVRSLEQSTYPPYRARAERYGHRSWAMFPLRERGRVTGAVAVYAAREDAFGEEELELIAELARDMGVALDHLEERAGRKSAQEALAQTQANLIVADRLASVGRLAAGVAHEINNPLAYVLMNTSAALEELQRALPRADPSLRPGLEEAAAALRESRAGSERVRLLVRDLKTFSRADAETRGPVDLIKVIDSSVSIAWNEIRHRARLVKDFQPVPEVLGNESRLGQVFLNLLVNAAQAIEPGSPERNEIRLLTRREGERAVAEVRDSGCGVPAEMQQRIFEPFFTTKPVGEGTGLGLAICHSIVAGLGGELSLESAPGKGSVFRLSLPLADSALPKQTPPPPAGGAAPAPRRARLLVIDDEPAVGNAVRRALSAEHEVVTLTSGGSALDLLARDQAFDAILCDLMMPEVSGMAVYQGLAERSPRLAEALVIMTGGAFTPEAQAFLDRVPNQRLEKPFDVQTLRALVRSALR